MARKLGRLPYRHDPRTLRLTRYLPLLPPLPAAADWSLAINAPWGDYQNSTVGDCAVAAIAHLQMVWTASSANLVIPDENKVLEAYSAISGYKPGDEPTDTGCVELDVLNFCRKNGIAGRAISAFVKVPNTQVGIQTAVHLFGGAYIGVDMPDDWESQLDAGQPWTWIPGDVANPANGHALPAVAYDADYVTVITWGQPQKATWEWVRNCCDEVWAILSPDFFNKNRQAPNAFDMAQLQTDLGAL